MSSQMIQSSEFHISWSCSQSILKLGASFAKMAKRVLLSRVKNCRIGIIVLRWNGSLGKNPREAAPKNLLENKRGFVCFLNVQNTLFIFRCLAALGMLKLFLNSSESSLFFLQHPDASNIFDCTDLSVWLCLLNGQFDKALFANILVARVWLAHPTQAGIHNRKRLGDDICYKESFS